jgi:hypothetical protein
MAPYSARRSADPPAQQGILERCYGKTSHTLRAGGCRTFRHSSGGRRCWRNGSTLDDFPAPWDPRLHGRRGDRAPPVSPSTPSRLRSRITSAWIHSGFTFFTRLFGAVARARGTRGGEWMGILPLPKNPRESLEQGRSSRCPVPGPTSPRRPLRSAAGIRGSVAGAPRSPSGEVRFPGFCGTAGKGENAFEGSRRVGSPGGRSRPRPRVVRNLRRQMGPATPRP